MSIDYSYIKNWLSERNIVLQPSFTEQLKNSAVLALCVVLNKSIDEINLILKRYGYCLSDSIAADAVVKWHICHSPNRTNGALLIFEINEVIRA